MWVDLLAATQEPTQASGVSWAQVLLAVVGPAGLVGSIVALFKLKPDANSQAVTQAQGAAAEWQKIADDRKKEIGELEDRLEVCQIELRRAQNRVFELEHPHPARDSEHGPSSS